MLSKNIQKKSKYSAKAVYSLRLQKCSCCTTVLLFDDMYSVQDSYYIFYNHSISTKKKLWEWYGKAWAIHGPYVGMAWEDQVMIWN